MTGGGSGYAAILAHAGGVLYGMELGSVTLKRIGFFCFQLNTQHTHTGQARSWSGRLKLCFRAVWDFAKMGGLARGDE